MNLFPNTNVIVELKRIKPPDFCLEEFKNTPYAGLSDLHLPVYITTNYDHFMEEALKSRGKEPVSEFCRWNEDLYRWVTKAGLISIFDKEKEYAPSPERPLVYHLFGVMDFASSMVLTESDYRNFVTYLNREYEKLTLPVVIRAALANSSLLFVGYNLQDIHFRSTFDGVLSMFGNINRELNVAVQLPPPLLSYNEKDRAMRYLEAHARNVFNMHLYWGNISEFIRELHQHFDKFRQ